VAGGQTTTLGQVQSFEVAPLPTTDVSAETSPAAVAPPER